MSMVGSAEYLLFKASGEHGLPKAARHRHQQRLLLLGAGGGKSRGGHVTSFTARRRLKAFRREYSGSDAREGLEMRLPNPSAEADRRRACWSGGRAGVCAKR